MNSPKSSKTTSVLTPAQIQSFKDEGYLILEDLIEPEMVEQWRRDLAEFFGADPNDENTRNTNVNGRSGSEFTFSPETSLRSHPVLSEITGQLSGGTFSMESELLIAIPPAPGHKWAIPWKGHIDLFLPFARERFMLSVTTYAYEVLPMGGGFTFWPRSHLANWEHFQNFPDDYYTRDLSRVNTLLSHQAPCGPAEFTAKPGTVLLWHSFLLHSGSINVGKTRRTAFFCRWGQKMGPGEPRETFGDIWENWAI